jgi:hypothetical protein
MRVKQLRQPRAGERHPLLGDGLGIVPIVLGQLERSLAVADRVIDRSL